MRIVTAGLVGLLGLLALSGCGSKSSYGAAEDGLRDWLAAAEAGDADICRFEHPDRDVNADLVRRYPELGGPGTSCAERAGRMPGIGLPASDSAMDVPVWDPSGEALVEATTDDGEVRSFWMQHDDGRWLVAGEAD